MKRLWLGFWAGNARALRCQVVNCGELDLNAGA